MANTSLNYTHLHTISWNVRAFPPSFFLLTAAESLLIFFKCTSLFLRLISILFIYVAILVRIHCLSYYSNPIFFGKKGHNCTLFFLQDQFNCPKTQISIWVLWLACHFLWRFWKKLHWIICQFGGCHHLNKRSSIHTYAMPFHPIPGFNFFQ